MSDNARPSVTGEDSLVPPVSADLGEYEVRWGYVWWTVTRKRDGKIVHRDTSEAGARLWVAEKGS